MSNPRPDRHSREFKKLILKRDNSRCVGCGVFLSLSGPLSKVQIDLKGYAKLTLDHIVPHSKGGTMTKSNIQAMCAPCNVAKADKMPAAEGAAAKEKQSD